MSTKWVAGMSPKVNMNRASDQAVWHAMSQARVVAALATDPEKALGLAEASAGRNMKYGPNRLPEGSKWGPFTRFFVQLNNILVYGLLHRVLQAVCRALGSTPASSLRFCSNRSQRIARIHSGGQSREGAGFDPQHALR